MCEIQDFGGLRLDFGDVRLDFGDVRLEFWGVRLDFGGVRDDESRDVRARGTAAGRAVRSSCSACNQSWRARPSV